MTSRKILIADDSKDILEGMRMYLEMKKFVVRTVSDADKILAEMLDFDPDLLILDVYLSGFDGRELCRQLKQREETKHIKIILFSAARNVLENFQNFGADDCLEKPFGLAEISEKIDSVLGKKEMNV